MTKRELARWDRLAEGPKSSSVAATPLSTLGRHIDRLHCADCRQRAAVATNTVA